MAWLSPIECAAETYFQSMPGVCTCENTAHRKDADINKVCFGVCTYENTAEGRGTKHANKNAR